MAGANAPGAKVTGEFDIALNAVAVKLNGATLEHDRVRADGPARRVQGLYRPPAHDDPDLALDPRLEAWTQAGGAADAGDGVKVAIIDTGIDVPHPCFADAGYPTRSSSAHGVHQQQGDRREGVQQQGGEPGYTPEDVERSRDARRRHGRLQLEHTGRRSTASSCRYEHSGVAPRALLGNYNVFPGDVADARSEDILDALEAAYERGLRRREHEPRRRLAGQTGPALAWRSTTSTAPNMVVAVAAGNSGPGFSTIESPGKRAARADRRCRTVGALRQLLRSRSTAPHVPGAAGDFGRVTARPTAPLGVVTAPASAERA